jgi:putative FmdB family regulatory protein
MPLYDFKCDRCGLTEELRIRVADLGDWRGHNCHSCVLGTMFRQFTPTANIAVPEHFKRSRTWHLPPSGHPAWEKMQPEGSGRAQATERPSLESEFQKGGLL